MTSRTPMAPTPSELLESDIVEGTRLVRGLLHELDLEQGELADAIGRRKQTVQLWASKTSKRLPSIADVRRMPRALARVLGAWMFGPHHIRLEDELVAQSPGEVMSLVAELLRNSLSADVLEAAGDGHIDAEEARGIRKRAVELRESATRIEAAMAQIERERGRALRPVP